MKEHLGRRQPTLMSKKYFSMLLSGTLTTMVVSVLLMSDSVIAGAVIGANAVAGITLVTPIYGLSAFFSTVISLGVPILYSTEMGKFNKERADQVFGLGVLMSIVVGIVLFLGTSLFGDAYLRSCSPPDAVLTQAHGYLFWMRFTILVLPIQMLMFAAVYCDGDETTSTIGNAVQGIGNVGGSILLSHVMGVQGIGLASFLFNVAALGVMCSHFLKESNSLRWNLYFSFDLLKDVVRYSIIDSSTYLFLAACTALLNAFVSAQFGPEYLILVSSVALCRELQMVFDGIGEAVTPIFSVYLGEKSHSGIRSIYSLASKTAIVEGIIVTLVLVVCAPFVPRVLNVTQPELAQLVVDGVRLTALGSTFVSLLYLITSYYLVIEQIALGFVVSALRDVVMYAVLVAILGKIWGFYGMFCGIAAAPALGWVFLLLYLRIRYGREDCPLLLSRIPGGEQTYLFNFAAEPKQIMDVQGRIGSLLREHNIDDRTIGRVELLVEELFMLIREKNGGIAVLCECSVLLGPDGVQLITRDEGVLFDISDEDMAVTSFGAYIVASYMESLGKNRRYLTTMSFNRSVFLIKPLVS